METFVIGHRNPDTDAICAAVGYAELLRRTRMPEAEAACCGPVNARTAWVLREAGIPVPRLLMDVRPTAGMICRTEVAKATEDETFLDVYQRMRQCGFRSVPVVDADGRILGMPTVLQLLELLVPGEGMPDLARHVRTTVSNMIQVLEAEVLAQGPEGGREEEFILTVGASSVETISSKTERFPAERMVVIVGDRPSVQDLGIRRGVRCLVLTGGFTLTADQLERAAERGVWVISTGRDTASASQLIRSSTRISGALRHDFLSFPTRALVRDIEQEVLHHSQPLFPVLEEETGRLVGVFSKSDLVQPPRVRLVLVDHNEFSQAVAGADEAEILEVLDHHRLSGNLVTREPVRFINEPVGSTSTIVALQFRQENLEPGRAAALCLAAGIISDTLNLTSPTATPADREMLGWLAGLAAIEVEAFAGEFFSAGSVLQTCTVREALGSDRKEYQEHGWRLSISQIEELGLGQFWPRKDELLEELDTLVRREGFDFACLMVTDITENDSMLLVAGRPEIVRLLEYPQVQARVYELPGVVSRKKQLFPLLSRLLARVIRSGVSAVEA